MESSEIIPSPVYKEVLHSWLVEYFVNQQVLIIIIIISPLLSVKASSGIHWFLATLHLIKSV